MQQFWYTVKKVKDSESYEFLLANTKCIIDAEVFRKILDIYPRVEGKEFTEVQDDDATLTFLIDLGYKGLLHKYTNMYVDHMNQPWRTLDDGIVSKLKFVRIGEDYQKYRLHIPDMMLNDAIKQLESYHMFIKYSSGQIPTKKSRGKGSQGKKTGDVSQESVDVSEEFKPKPAKKKTGSRSSSEGTGRTPGVLDESTVISATSSEGTGTKPGVLDEENVISEANVILEWGSENEIEHSDDSQLNFDVKENKDNDSNAEDKVDHHISDIQDTNDEDAKTESDEDEIYKYKIYVRKDVDVEMGEAKTVERENKEKDEMTYAAKAGVKKTTEKKVYPFHLDLVLNSLTRLLIFLLLVFFDGYSYPTRNSPDPTQELASQSISEPGTVVVMIGASVVIGGVGIGVVVCFIIKMRHTADLIQKYSVKPAPESSKIQKPTINLEQEYEKSAS
nr:hypothetical protein [Tanacetum cinerariifolium]